MRLRWFVWLAVVVFGSGVAWFVYVKALRRDGSSFERAIVLHVQGPKRRDAEWRWIGDYYPEASVFPFKHSQMVYHQRDYSYYSVATPRGQKDVYFETGELVDR